jgi:uncharacterized membrane protein YtjA (UPF0391 family)
MFELGLISFIWLFPNVLVLSLIALFFGFEGIQATYSFLYDIGWYMPFIASCCTPIFVIGPFCK